MDTRCIIANTTEKAVPSVMRVDLQGQLVASHLDTLDGATHRRGPQLIADRGQAERVKRWMESGEIKAHETVGR